MKKRFAHLKRPVSAVMAVLMAVGLAFEGGGVSYAAEVNYNAEANEERNMNSAGDDTEISEVNGNDAVENDVTGEETAEPEVDTPEADAPEIEEPAPEVEEPSVEDPIEDTATPTPEEEESYSISMEVPYIEDTGQFLYEYKLTYPIEKEGLPSPEGLFVLTSGETQILSGIPMGTVYSISVTVPAGYTADRTSWGGVITQENVSIRPNVTEAKTVYTASADNVTVTATVSADSGLPAGSELRVAKLSESSYLQTVESWAGTDDVRFAPYDVYFQFGSSRVEPAGTVQVSMSFSESPFTDTLFTEISVLQITDNGSVVEPVTDHVSVSDLKFSVNSLSVMGPVIFAEQNDKGEEKVNEKDDNNADKTAVQKLDDLKMDETGVAVDIYEDGKVPGLEENWQFDFDYAKGEKPDNEEDFLLKYQMRFANNIDIPQYGVMITVPMTLGSMLPYEIAVPEAEDMEHFVESEDTSFNYCIVMAEEENEVDSFVFFNYEDLKAGTDTAWQVLYMGDTPADGTMSLIAKAGVCPDPSIMNDAGDPVVEESEKNLPDAHIDVEAEYGWSLDLLDEEQEDVPDAVEPEVKPEVPGMEDQPGIEEPDESEDEQNSTYTASCDGVIVSVETDADSGLPEDAVLEVKPLDPDKSETINTTVRDRLGIAEEFQFLPYDISFMSGEVEVEPLSPVRIVMTFDERMFDQDGDVSAVHVRNDGTVEQITPEAVSDTEITFTVDSFSVMGPMKISKGTETETPESDETETPESDGMTIEELATLDKDVAGAAVEYGVFDTGENSIMSDSTSNGKKWTFNIYYVGEDDLHDIYVTNDFSVKYQMEFHTSQHLPQNAVEIKIPRKLMQNRDGGNVNPTDIAVPVVEGKEQHISVKNSPFNCYVEGDNLVFFNYMEINAGTNAAWQVVYGGIDVMNIIDESTWNIQATAKVAYQKLPEDTKPGTGEAQNIEESETPQPLTGKVNTEAKLLNVKKVPYSAGGYNYSPGLYTKSQVRKFIGSLPSKYDGDLFSNYSYVVWEVTAEGRGTQPFDLWIKDSTNTTYGEGEIVGYSCVIYDKDSIKEKYGSEQQAIISDYENIKQDYQERNWTQRFYVVTAYNASLSNGITVRNTIDMVLVPADLKDKETKMSSSTQWSYKEYDWDYKGDVIGIGKNGEPSSSPGWIEVYKQSAEKGRDNVSDFKFYTRSECRSYKITHNITGNNIGERITGASTRIVTVDDAVYAYPEGSDEEILLNENDYYFTSVKIEQTDTGYDVYEDIVSDPETTDEDYIDQGLKIYAMFADTDGQGTESTNWEEVTYVDWNESGVISYSFSLKEIAKKPYRVMAVHDTINYNTQCDIEVSLHIRPDSETVKKIMESNPVGIRFENISGVSGQRLFQGTPNNGIGTEAYFNGALPGWTESYFHNLGAENGNYSEQGLKEFTTGLYGLLLMRDSSFVEGKAVEYNAGVAKLGYLTNDPINENTKAIYDISIFDGYIVGSPNIAHSLLNVGVDPPDMKSVVVYDLLPTFMKMDASYKVTATRMLDFYGGTSNKNVSVDWEVADTNYNNTGRTMIKFTINYNGDAPYEIGSFSDNNIINYQLFQGWTLRFRGYWDWKDVNHSDNTENIIAVMSNDDNKFIAASNQTYPDDGSGAKDEFEPFGSDIDKDGETEDQVMFAKSIVTGDIAIASESTISKGVKADSNKYGTFVKSEVVEPGGGYMYDITVENLTKPITDIVIFDRLENAAVDRKGTADEMQFDEKYWHGTFSSVITQPLDDKGIKYTVWYNTQRDARLPSTDEDPMTVLTDANGWKKKDEFTGDPSSVQAVAVSLDDNFVLNSAESVGFQISMKAPMELEEGAVWAYNNPSFYRKIVDDDLDRQTVVGDSVRIRLGNIETLEVIKEYEDESQVPETLKTKNQEFEFYAYNIIDGEEENQRMPFAITEYSLYTLDEKKEWQKDPEKHATDASGRFYLRVGQKAVFENVPDASRIKITESEDPFWEALISSEKSGSKTTVTVRNKAVPVVYFQKKAANGTPETNDEFRFKLTVNDKPASNVTYWLVDHPYMDGRIPEKQGEGQTNENGEFSLHAGDIAAILKSGNYGDQYKIQEIDPGDNWIVLEGNDTVSGTLNEYGSYELITNFYKWKDLLLTKTVNHQSPEDVKNKEFTFKIEHIEIRDDGSEILTPVVGNDWELTATGEKGQLGNQGEFTCRAGEGVVTVHKLVAGQKYRITETGYDDFYQPVNNGITDIDAPLYASSVKVEFVNEWTKRPLTVSKTLIYDYKNSDEAKKAKDTAFEMTVLCDQTGTGTMTPLANYPYVLTAGGVEVIPGSADDPYGQGHSEAFKTDAQGKFKIKGGQVAEFKDAGVNGSQFSITETPDPQYPQLVPSGNAAYQDFMNDEGGKASIVNGVPGSLVIKKEWVGLDETGKKFIEAGKNGNSDLSVDITMNVTMSDGTKKQWPEKYSVNVTEIKNDGSYGTRSWSANYPFTLYPFTTILINGTDIAGVTSYEIKESSEDQHRIFDWNDQDGKLHHIMESQKEPEKDGAVSGSLDSNPEAVLINSASEINEVSRIGKRLINPDKIISNGIRLILAVEKYDGKYWNPVANVPYVYGHGSQDKEKFSSDHIEYTGQDGKITMESSNDGLPWIIFIQDKVYAMDVINPQIGDMRIRELLDESDSAWGHYVGIGVPANDGSYTTDLSELDRDGDTIEEFFVNATTEVPVRVGKALDGDSENEFTFTLKQITEIDGTKYKESGGITQSNYKDVIRKSYPQQGIRFVIYDMNSHRETGNGMTDSSGQFHMKGNQYVELNLPENTLWTVSEDVSAGFTLKSLEEYVDISKREENDSSILGKLEDNLMLIGDNTGYSKARKFTLILDPDGGDIAEDTGWNLNDGKLYKKGILDNSSVDLPDNIPFKDGVSFKGWQFENEDKIYNPGDSFLVSGSLVGNGESITLHATWKEQPPAILYSDGTLVFYENASESAYSEHGDIVDQWYGWDTEIYDAMAFEHAPWYKYTYDYRHPIKAVEFNGTVRPRSTACWFAEFDFTTFDDFSGLDTSNVVDMGEMFGGCYYATSINLAGFDTSNVKSMKGMFSGCGSLETLDLSGLNMSNVDDMYMTFADCSNLTSLTLPSRLPKLEGLGETFSNCSSLRSLVLPLAPNVVSLAYTFNNCSSLTDVNLSGLQNVSNAINMMSMFAGCSSLKELDVSKFNTQNVKIFTNMFKNCSSLTSIKGLYNFDTPEATSFSGMFEGCSSLTSLDIYNFDLSKLTDGCCNRMFYGCSNLSKIIATDQWVYYSPVTTSKDVFTYCTSLPNFDPSKVDGNMCTPYGGYFTDYFAM